MYCMYYAVAQYLQMCPLKLLQVAVNSAVYVCSVTSDICDPMNYSQQGSSAHGIFQARILEWAAISYSRGKKKLPNPGGQTCVSCVSCIASGLFTIEPSGRPLLQIFSSQRGRVRDGHERKSNFKVINRCSAFIVENTFTEYVLI